MKKASMKNTKKNTLKNSWRNKVDGQSTHSVFLCINPKKNFTTIHLYKSIIAPFN